MQVYGNMHSIWRPLPASIRIYLIFLETTIIFLHFASYSIGLSSLKFFSDEHINFVYFNVTDVGSNRKRVCDFLLVRNSNLGPILHRLADCAALMFSWPTPIPP